jgi:hypothetical protein
MNLADTLNLGCLCRTLNTGRLREQLETDPSLKGLASELAQTHPHLFSQTAVFLDPATRNAVTRAVAALDRVMELPAWQSHALAHAAPIARHAFGPAGVFMGYDFHLGPDGPRLIEINTNAGGAFLNAALARAHRACCESMGALMDATAPGLPSLDDTFMAMFRSEWQAQRGDAPWRTVLVVDDAPQAQYLARSSPWRATFLNHTVWWLLSATRARCNGATAGSGTPRCRAPAARAWLWTWSTTASRTLTSPTPRTPRCAPPTKLVPLWSRLSPACTRCRRTSAT